MSWPTKERHGRAVVDATKITCALVSFSIQGQRFEVLLSPDDVALEPVSGADDRLEHIALEVVSGMLDDLRIVPVLVGEG